PTRAPRGPAGPAIRDIGSRERPVSRTSDESRRDRAPDTSLRVQDDVRERRNARYLSSSSSSSAVRSSIANTASLLRRAVPFSEGRRYPAFSITASYGTPSTSATTYRSV